MRTFRSAVIKILNIFGYRKTLVINTLIIGVLICCLAIPNSHTNIFWFILIVSALGFFNSIQFTSMESISIADLRQFHTGSGNSLAMVNQRLAVGFDIALGLLILKFFQGIEKSDLSGIHSSFRCTFLIIGAFTIISALAFKKLHYKDGDNLKSI